MLLTMYDIDERSTLPERPLLSPLEMTHLHSTFFQFQLHRFVNTF